MIKIFVAGKAEEIVMAKITINENVCKGCELCVAACPKGLLALCKDKMNAKGYHPAGIEEMDKCIGCAFCAPTVQLRLRSKKGMNIQWQKEY